MAAAGARDVASALASASALVQAGVPASWRVWRRAPGPGLRPTGPAAVGPLTVATVHGGGGPPPNPEPVPPGRRGDLPVRRDVRRACKRSALEAALAEHRQEALADLDENVLVRSSQGPFQWRVRTWGRSVPGVGRRPLAYFAGGGAQRRGVAASGRLPLCPELL